MYKLSIHNKKSNKTEIIDIVNSETLDIDEELLDSTIIFIDTAKNVEVNVSAKISKLMLLGYNTFGLEYNILLGGGVFVRLYAEDYREDREGMTCQLNLYTSICQSLSPFTIDIILEYKDTHNIIRKVSIDFPLDLNNDKYTIIKREKKGYTIETKAKDFAERETLSIEQHKFGDLVWCDILTEYYLPSQRVRIVVNGYDYAIATNGLSSYMTGCKHLGIGNTKIYVATTYRKEINKVHIKVDEFRGLLDPKYMLTDI